MPATLEGQIARYADRIAYINHDIDDAIRAEILTPRDLPEGVRAVLGHSHPARIQKMVGDLVATSTDKNEISMSGTVFDAMSEARTFLFERLYMGVIAPATQTSVETIVGSLLEHYSSNPVPDQVASEIDDPKVLSVDYVAGMTDRFALRAFQNVVGAPPPAVAATLG
jgi:dGTPase